MSKSLKDALEIVCHEIDDIANDLGSISGQLATELDSTYSSDVFHIIY
jgi:hypothetical protein